MRNRPTFKSLFTLKSQYVSFAARGHFFKKITKAQLDDAVNECGIMGVVIFTFIADEKQSDRNRVHR